MNFWLCKLTHWIIIGVLTRCITRTFCTWAYHSLTYSFRPQTNCCNTITQRMSRKWLHFLLLINLALRNMLQSTIQLLGRLLLINRIILICYICLSIILGIKLIVRIVGVLMGIKILLGSVKELIPLLNRKKNNKCFLNRLQV